MVAAICALTAALTAQTALAAGEVGDAGELPLTAQEPGPAGALESITGDVGSADSDMYKICIADAAGFSASTVNGSTGFDTQLFLFDESGQGVYANDDDPGSGTLLSRLPAGQGPTAPGVYHLAISAFDRDPQSAPGRFGYIFPSSSGVIGPTDRGGADPVTGWEHRLGSRPGGGYTITLTGTRSCVDTTPPTVELTSPSDGAEYAQNETVLADYACADEPEGSGLASCEGDVPDGRPIDTATLGAHEFTVTARDRRGNVTTVTHTYTVVDETAPSVDLRTPRDGAAYPRGELVRADYYCADEPGGSGLASCTGDVPDDRPIDTSTPGDHTFTVRAVDGAGNVATRTVGYRVEERFAFEFEGFFSPVANRPRVNWVKAGAVVPIRFSLDGWQGREVIADGYPRSREMKCGSIPDLDGGDPTRSPGRWRLRYKPRRDLYVYLWKTDRDWSGECRQFILKLSDGSYHRADFRFLRKRHHWHDIWDG